MVSKKSVLFSFLLFSISSLLLNCCNNAVVNQEPVKDYFEYWSETITIGRYGVDSPYQQLGGVKNLSARDPVEIQVVLTNPKRYDIGLLNEDNEANFQILDQDGDDVATEKSASLSQDKSVITLNAKLNDDTEKEILALKGAFDVLKGEDIISFETIEYSYEFKQNTPPDRPRNLRNPETPDAATGYHHLHFDYPPQVVHETYKRHDNLTYEVSCYLNEGDGRYTFVDSAKLTNADSYSSSEFSYYFPQQEPNFQYEYVVTFYNPEGLKSETVSTVPGIGVCYVTDPLISFGINGEFNGLTVQQNGHSYDVIEYTGHTLDITVENTCPGASLDLDINGTVTSGVNQTKAIANDSAVEGFRDIKVTISKNLCRPVLITKHVYVVRKLTDPEITGANGTVSDDVLKYSYLYNDNGKLNVTNSYMGNGTTMVITIDDEEQALGDVLGKVLDDGDHTVSWYITKDYCRPLSNSKTITVKIKPVTVKFSGNGFTFHGADDESGDTIDLCGSVCAKTDDTSGGAIKSWWNEEVSKSAFWVSLDSNPEFTMTTRDSKFYFWAENMADKDGDNLHSLGNLSVGNASSTRTLEYLKEVSRDFNQVGGNGEGYFNCTFTLILSEE